MYFVSVLPGVAQRIARAAHNREVTRSKRVAGIYHHFASVHQGTWATLFTPLAQRKSGQAHNLVVVRSKRTGGTTYRDGAEGARGAHNSEVVGSNPTSGIISIR